MSGLTRSPRLTKGGIVLLDPENSTIKRIITLQYNPQTLTRSLQIQGTSSGSNVTSEALRLIGPPIETIKLEAEIDATDQLEFPDKNPNTVAHGIHPQIAALESLIYPTTDQIQKNNSLAQSGTLEIIPMETPLVLFIWSPTRILPVRITDFSVTEEAFDLSLNPLQAKVSIGMRVLNINDLGFSHKGGSLFMNYHKQREKLAAMMESGQLAGLGVGGIP